MSRSSQRRPGRWSNFFLQNSQGAKKSYHIDLWNSSFWFRLILFEYKPAFPLPLYLIPFYLPVLRCDTLIFALHSICRYGHHCPSPTIIPKIGFPILEHRDIGPSSCGTSAYSIACSSFLTTSTLVISRSLKIGEVSAHCLPAPNTSSTAIEPAANEDPFNCLQSAATTL